MDIIYEDELKKVVGNRVRLLRKENNLTQEQLSELLDCNARNISEIERGVNALTFSNLVKLSNIFKVSPHWFFGNNFESLELSQMFNMLNKKEKRAVRKLVEELLK